MTGCQKIAVERRRQVKEYDYDEDHDRSHTRQELMRYAFAILAFHLPLPVQLDEWFRAQPTWIQQGSERHPDYEDALKTAGALIAAELDRIQDKPH